MPHIVLLKESTDILDAMNPADPSGARNLNRSLQGADEYAHGEEPDEGVIDALTAKVAEIHDYLTTAQPPQDTAMQEYADDVNGILP